MADFNRSDNKNQPKPTFGDGVTSENFAALRYPSKPKPVALSALAIDWILHLPPAVRPTALGKQYPRIANVLAGAWNHPHRFEARFQEFTSDKRGDRQGFPELVAIELDNLRKYHLEVSQLQSKHSMWDPQQPA